MLEKTSSEVATVQERLALLERAASSRQLRRAARLREFLLYVGKQVVEHGVESIPEQQIGHAVFGRAESYDTSLDNIVRVNASELRKRLEQYFEEEGSSEELILTIPRGSYTPLFSRRLVPATAAFYEVKDERVQESEKLHLDEPSPVAKILLSTLPYGTRWLVTGMSVALLILATAYIWQGRQYRAVMEPWRSDRALNRFWTPFFASQDGVDVVLADTSLAMAKDISGQSVSLESYIHFNYKDPAAWKGFSQDRQQDLAQVLNRGNVSLGDVHVAQQILALNPYGKALHLYSAREFTSETARQNNIILIGSRESNPWVDLFQDQINFSVEYETATHRPYVLNRSPQPGEQRVYEAPTDPARTNGYAVIACVHAIRPNHWALIIGGTDAQATRAAGELVTQPGLLNALLEKLPTDKTVAFEGLFRTTQLTGTPLRSELVAVRVHR